MTDYASGKWGGFQFPLTASTSNSLLKDADKTLYYALDFFRAMLETHISARFVAEATACKYVDVTAGNVAFTRAVNTVISFDPAPFLTQTQFKFPLLSLSRNSGTYVESTVARRRNVAEFTLRYTMAPMSAAQAQAMLPILNAAARVLANRCEQGMDPGYTPPGSSAGASVWTLAGLDKIGFVSERFGNYFDTEKNLAFNTWEGVIQAVERTEYVASDFESLVTAGANIDLATTGGTTYEDVVQILSDTST